MSSSPDEKAFARDCGSARFLAGVDRGSWRIESIAWPYAVIAVRDASLSAVDEVREIGLRFELTGYPGLAPTAAPWDIDGDQPLPRELWPIGDRISQVFNPNWRLDALYMPFDRIALEGHEMWAAQHPGYIWGGDSDITRYLEFVIDLLDVDLDSRAEEDADAAKAA